jgi:hypothetical protein
MAKVATALILASLLAGPAIAAVGPTTAVPRPAPAPLLAAGIPAFVALGGVGLVARLRRRKSSGAADPTSDR